jgi:MFS family permease
MYLSAICAALSLVLMALLYRDPPEAGATAPARLRLDLSKPEWLLVCIAGAIWALFNVAYIVLVSFTPDLFVQRGFTLVDASRIVSLIGWTLIASIPLASLISERLGRPRLVLFLSCALLALAAAILPFAAGLSFFVCFAAVVLLTGVPPSLIMALPAQVLSPQNRASGMGIYYTWYYAAMAVLPGGAGLARDLTGSAAGPTLFAAALMLLCAVGILLFHAASRVTKQ